MQAKHLSLSGWGRYPVQDCEVWRPERYRDLLLPEGPMTLRGQGRSYGDAAVNEGGNVVLSERINRFIEFNAETGLLRAEPGTTLEEIIELCLPRGWFLPVTPGTKYVSLGGCVAADVHGKNHYRDGSFAAAVQSFELITADGARLSCARDNNSELFFATLGGMGLTGIIGEVTLQLRKVDSAFMQVRQRKSPDLERVFADLSAGEAEDEYRVAWIDCLARGKRLGRSVTMSARHAGADELSGARGERPLQVAPRRGRTFPFDLPSWFLNSLSIGAFNRYYYAREGARRGPFVSDYDRYFYPLDAIAHWNRLYGRRGFVQYQCVLPLDGAFDGMRDILGRLSRSRRPSFLAVLKRLGEESGGLLSFPMAGYTLALDLLPLLDELDRVVIEHGGRVYLAKDARLSAEAFRSMYPRLGEWLEIKNRIDPGNRFTSSLARRLGLEAGHG
jgi:decaprenylphospho-beta-D-ribofuranose 2-oxidase